MDNFPRYTPAPDRYDHMPYARSGASGLKLPRVSLGLWHNFGDDADRRTQRDILRTAFDLGVTHFDLANNYGPPYGAAEESFGRHLAADWRPFRDELLISSKAGYDMWPGPYGDGSSRKYLVSSLDQSLARMGLEYVDIFYSHRRDPETPIDETMRALDQIVRSGKALYVGISSYNAQDTAEAARIMRELGTPLTIHQPRYSMLDRWIEEPGAHDSTDSRSLLRVLEEEGIGSIAFSPLEQGLLTDRYLDGIPADSRAGHDGRYFSERNITPERLAKVRALAPTAKERGQTIAQLAITWILRPGGVTSALVGASSAAQLRDTVTAATAPELTAEQLAAVEEALAV
ncbi:L-glyceraldehyde 3-phosphate reductase [Salana multivorans]|uniref:L-glyceraldehyde 3-phosphate reductase n=2 Tax=Salana multivorans TaxID=120377 RepID=A0A3N2DAK4_9MICO|nr:L-glyceraldehyde 3-phosphate reductase [Salana multivorans]